MRILSILPLLFISIQIHAQSKANGRFVIGFFAGLETQSMGIQALDAREPEEATVQPGPIGMGSSVGLLARKHLWKGLFFQPGLSVSSIKNQISYRTEGLEPYHTLEAELPLHMVLTNWNSNDFPLHGCILFGTRMAWNFAENSTERLTIAQERFGLDIGLGAEFRIGKWQIQPAIVYSHGLNNLHRIDDAQYDIVVGRIVRDKLAFRLSFWLF